MTSNDVLTVREFQAGLDGLKVYVDGRISEVNARISELRADVQLLARDVRDNAIRIEGTRDFIGWGFSLMALIIALVGFSITLAPMFREMYKNVRKPTLTEERVQELINNALNALPKK